MRWFLDPRPKNYHNADGKMADELKRACIKKYETEPISAAEAAFSELLFCKRDNSDFRLQLFNFGQNFCADGPSLCRSQSQTSGVQDSPIL
jgi:hypothetical protein